MSFGWDEMAETVVRFGVSAEVGEWKVAWGVVEGDVRQVWSGDYVPPPWVTVSLGSELRNTASRWTLHLRVNAEVGTNLYLQTSRRIQGIREMHRNVSHCA